MSAFTRLTLAPSSSRPTLGGRAAARPTVGRGAKLAIVAALPREGGNDSSSTTRSSGGSPLTLLQERFASFDFLSAGVGALCVTSYCVWRGQDPLTALEITAASTVVAVVANELMVEAERKQQE